VVHEASQRKSDYCESEQGREEIQPDESYLSNRNIPGLYISSCEITPWLLPVTSLHPVDDLAPHVSCFPFIAIWNTRVTLDVQSTSRFDKNLESQRPRSVMVFSLLSASIKSTVEVIIPTAHHSPTYMSKMRGHGIIFWAKHNHSYSPDWRDFRKILAIVTCRYL
jgi:hypothetical protein